MDQEQFDQHLIDYLFDELDEVTTAAMRRKLDADAGCRELEAGLRATVEMSALPLEEPSDDLEERILMAANLAEDGAPWHAKLLRSLTWAGSHAMRPQLAMAAMLVLVLGSSLLLLRARPGTVAVTPMKDEAGSAGPASEAKTPPSPDSAPELAALPTASPVATAAASALAQRATADRSAAPAGDSDDANTDQDKADSAERFDRGMANYKAGKHREAQADFAAVNQRGGAKASTAALYEARAVRSHSGCAAAVPYYTAVRQRYGSSGVAGDATWEQADCHRLLGQRQEARNLWLALKTNDSYSARAISELSSEAQTGTSTPGGSGANAAAQPRKVAAPSPKAAPPPPPEEKPPVSKPNPTSVDSAL